MENTNRRAVYLFIALLAFACAMYAVLLYVASFSAARTYLVPLGLESPFVISPWGAKVGQHVFTSSSTWFFVGLASWVCGSWVVFFMRPKSDLASRFLPVTRALAVCAMIAVSYFAGSCAGSESLGRAMNEVQSDKALTYYTKRGVIKGAPVALQNGAVWLLTKDGTQLLKLDEIGSIDIRSVPAARRD